MKAIEEKHKDMKLMDWITIITSTLTLTLLLAVIIACKSIAVQVRDLIPHEVERVDSVDSVDTVSESVKNDTLKPWLEMYYCGEKGVRIKCETMGIDTTVKQSLYFNVDNTNKKIYFLKEDTIAF